MKKWRNELKRLFVVLLTAALVGNTINFSALTVSAETAGQTEESSAVIVSFGELSEEVREQLLPVGANESDISFPNTLTVTVEKTAPEEETGTGEKTVSGGDAGEGTDGQIISEDITLENITWELDADNSDSDTFLSDESANGYFYTYVPVLPETVTLTDSEGEVCDFTLTLDKNVYLPEIYVLVGDSGIATFSADGHYDDDGFCNGYTFDEDGNWVEKTGEDACEDDGCNGYEPATLTIDTYDIDGDGTKDNVYEIGNAGQLYWFAYKVNKEDTTYGSANAVLTADITVNSDVLDASGDLNTGDFRSWTPIGLYDGDTNCYKGTFDGKNHTFSGLYYIYTGTGSDIVSYAGLFGCVGDGGKVSNVGVVDSYFELNFKGTYYGYIGGVCGTCGGGGVIENCYNKGKVFGNCEDGIGVRVGGVCGFLGGTLKNCLNEGVVIGNSKSCAGGVCGQNYDATIENCSNKGEVSGTNSVGGVCGYNYAYDGSPKIESCSNTGEVSGTDNVGGVCGYNDADYGNYTVITNCYNTGEVTGTGYGVGGVSGGNEVSATSTITNCYNSGKVNGNYVSGVIGVNYDTAPIVVTNCYYLSETATDDGGKTEEQFKNGSVCYLLNGEKSEGTEDNPLAWYQNIDNGANDAYPLLDSNGHGTVYASAPCPSEFSNTPGQVVAHIFEPDGNDRKKHICATCGLSEEHHSAYAVNSQTTGTSSIKVTCGDCEEELGIVTLSAPTGTLTYNGNAKEAVISNNVTGVTISDPTITYSKTGDTTFSGTPKDAGTYTASITLGEDEGAAKVSVKFTIEKATPELGTVSVTTLNNTLNTSEVEFSRTDMSVSGTFALKEGTELQYGTHDYSYVFTPTGDDAVNYKPVEGTVSITVKDNVCPDVAVKVKDTTWKSIQNAPAFGSFFKAAKDIDVEASDSTSGVAAIFYYISDSQLSEESVKGISDSNWKAYDSSNKPSLSKGTYYVYVKVKDNAGNKTYVGTDGIVIYEDSTPDTAGIEYTYKESRDKTIAVHLNGNTVAAIKEKDGKELAEGKDYSVDRTNETITVTKSYLDGLDASDTPYTLTVSYNPQGKTYKEKLDESGRVDLNDAPGKTVISVKVAKASLTVTKATATSRVYDKTNKVEITAVTLSGIKGTDDVSVNTSSLTGTLSSANAGNYTSVTLPPLTLTGADAGNYTLVQPTGAVPTNVTIRKADAQITVGTDTFNKTFGDAAFELDVTDNNTEANVQYDVSTDVVSVSNGTVTILKAGSATITVSLPASTNYNAAASEKITVTVAKKSGYAVGNINRSCLYSRENAENIDLSKYLPADCGNVTYGTPQVNGDLYTADGQPAVSSAGKLSYTVKKGSVGANGTIKVTVTTDNYEGFTLTVNVNLTDKLPVTLSGVTCGSRAYNGTAYAYTGTPVWRTAENVTATGTTTVTYYKAGDFSAPVDAPTDAGSYWAEFTITSDKYVGTESCRFEITKAVITVAAKNKSIYVGDTVPALTNPTAVTDYTVTGLYGTDVLSGTAIMSYAQEPDNTKTGTYEILIRGLTAPEGDNYTVTFTNGTLTITPKPSGGSSGNPGSEGGSGGSSGGSTGGGSSFGGGNSSGSGSTSGVTTVRDSGSNAATTTSPTEVKVENGTASATVKAENVAEAIKQAAENKSAQIVFTVSEKDTKNADRIQLTITKADVKQILDKTSADLIVATTAGNVILPKEALKETVSAAGGDTITIEIDKVTAPTAVQKEAAGENSCIVEVTVTSQNKAITTFGGNVLKIRLEIPAALAGKDVAVIHIAEDGKTEKMPGKMVTEGTKQYYEFTTTHLSTFALVEETGTKEEAPAATAPKKGTLLTDSKTQMVYKVTKSGTTGGTVQFVKTKNTKAKTVAIPDKVTIDGITYKVTSIAAGALKNNKTVTTVTIGKNVTTIGSGAFSGCTRLKKVTIGKNVTAIGSKAFYNCSSLTALTIPSRVEKIGNYAFGGCSSLKTIRIKTTLLTTKTVSEYAFSGISARTVIKVPKSRLKTYKILFVKKGLDKKVVIKKW